MKQLIVRNFWLKLTALFLAAILWVYVVAELNKGMPEERAFFDRMMPYKMEAKQIPIKINLIGNPPRGFRILHESISVKPSTCVILAPRNLLKQIDYITTEIIDVSEYTKPIVKEIQLMPIGAGIVLEKRFMISVIIPIEKIEPPAEVKK